MKKRIELDKKFRVFFIVLVVLVISVCIILIFKEVKYTGYVEEKITLYSFKSKEDIRYKVFLRPNILYDTDSLGEENIYISEFVDYIDTTFKYEFTGEKEANIEGTYELIAKMEGYTGNEKEGTVRTIWAKNFIIVPIKDIKERDKNLSIEEKIQLNLREYNDFVKSVLETSKIGISVKMNVFMEVNLKINTESGIKELKQTPNMTIPLNTNYFEISRRINKEVPGSIEKIEQIPLPVNNFKVGLFALIQFVAWVTLAFIIFKTKSTKRSPLEIELKRVFKKYGDRLVALNKENIPFEAYSEVKSIEDLVRIADELARPIMYKYNKSYEKISKFYVFDEKIMYILSINVSTHTDPPTRGKKKDKVGNVN